MANTTDVMSFAYAAQETSALKQLVRTFAQHYGLSNNYRFTARPTLQPGHHPRTVVNFDGAENSFSVEFSFGAEPDIDLTDQREREQSIRLASRSKVLGPLALRTLAAQDKHHFLQAISECRPREPQLWHAIDHTFQRSTEFEKAELIACLVAGNVEETDYPGHIGEANHPWSQVLARKSLAHPRADTLQIMKCLAANVRRHGLSSQKTFPIMGTLPERIMDTCQGKPVQPPQIGDGSYEGPIVCWFKAPDKTLCFLQSDNFGARILLHRAEAFSGNIPFECRPFRNQVSLAMSYADGQATWQPTIQWQKKLLTSLSHQLPANVSIVRSWPWDAKHSFRGPIIPLPCEIRQSFVMQQSDADATVFYVHLTDAFDYIAQAKTVRCAQTETPESVEIVSDGQGRMLARPYFRKDAGITRLDFEQQLKALQRKIPASAQALLQVGQPDTRYTGPMLACTTSFILQGTYPVEQHTAVPVIHWRKDLNFSEEQTRTLDAQMPGTDLYLNYLRDGRADGSFTAPSPKHYPHSAEPSPAEPAALRESNDAAHNAKDALESSIAHQVLERNIPQIDLSQLNIGDKAVLCKAQPGSRNEGYVFAHDAHRVFLQLAGAGTPIVVYPKAAFVGSGLPKVDPHARIKIDYDDNKANATPMFVLNVSSSTRTRDNSSPRNTPPNSPHARAHSTSVGL